MTKDRTVREAVTSPDGAGVCVTETTSPSTTHLWTWKVILLPLVTFSSVFSVADELNHTLPTEWPSWGVAIILLALMAHGLSILLVRGFRTVWSVCIKIASKIFQFFSRVSAGRRSKKDQEIAYAEITSVLVPLVRDVGFQVGTIHMVGSDGGYLRGPNGNKLKRAFVKWTARGICVRYTLVRPSDDALRELVFLQHEIKEDPNCTGALEVQVLSGRRKDLPASIKVLVSILTTYHPTLIWSRDEHGKAMWLEGVHEPEDFVSYDNRWVPPAAMGDAAPPYVQQLHGRMKSLTWSDVFSMWDQKLNDLSKHTQPVVF